jgi:hypothetical protein
VIRAALITVWLPNVDGSFFGGVSGTVPFDCSRSFSGYVYFSKVVPGVWRTKSKLAGARYGDVWRHLRNELTLSMERGRRLRTTEHVHVSISVR